MSTDDEFAEVELVEVVDDSRPQARPWLTVFLTLVVFAAYFVAQQLVVVAFLAIALGKNPNLDVMAWAEEVQYNGQLLSVCTVVAAAVSIPLVRFAARLASPGAYREHLGLRMPEAGSVVRWLLALAAFIAVTDGTNWLLGRDIVPPFMREAYLTAGWPPLLWFALVVAAPVTEELLFRGLLFGGLAASRLGPVAAAVVTSLPWAGIHLQYDLFDMGTVFLAGLLLATARYATQSVILCIILHSAMNLIATIEAVVALRME